MKKFLVAKQFFRGHIPTAGGYWQVFSLQKGVWKGSFFYVFKRVLSMAQGFSLISGNSTHLNAAINYIKSKYILIGCLSVSFSTRYSFQNNTNKNLFLSVIEETKQSNETCQKTGMECTCVFYIAWGSWPMRPPVRETSKLIWNSTNFSYASKTFSSGRSKHGPTCPRGRYKKYNFTWF